MSKMAVLDTRAFLDPKAGILKFTVIVTKLNGEFQKLKDEITQMQQRAQTLEAEISKLRSAPVGTPIDERSLEAKVDQLDQLEEGYSAKGRRRAG